jgi:2-polyprenyl-3-methyl-5-hydroxy-6-metoxy-1,4-benzoquinol methylase
VTVDPDKLQQLVGKVVGDLGGAASGALVLLGDRLGLFKSLASSGPQTPEQLAKHTKTNSRLIREWLNAMAASGYATYDSASGKFSLDPEQAMAFANEDSPAFMPGGFQAVASMWLDEDKVAKSFKSGKGVDWGQHHKLLFEGTERFFRPGYNANLISAWIPALDGVKEKLEKGALVADVGCGHGSSTILMAKSFPKSTFVGFDYHKPSVQAATKRAKAAGVSKNAKFQVAKSTNFPGKGYDFVTCFDCLHDMSDPQGAAKHIRKRLKPDGVWMIVEPYAKDTPEENHNMVGRVFYSASTMICVGVSLAQGGPGLGAQAGEKRLAEVIRNGGFTRVRRATETPFNIILEARPLSSRIHTSFIYFYFGYAKGYSNTRWRQ